MPRSQHSDAYTELIRVLIDARKAAGMTQVQLSAALGKPQPFISKVEKKVRRIDVVEFIAIMRALETKPEEAFALLLRRLPKRLDI